jgi:hypothetical protein
MAPKEQLEQLDLLDLLELQQLPLSLLFANFTSSQVSIAMSWLAEIRPSSLVEEAIAEPMVLFLTVPLKMILLGPCSAVLPMPTHPILQMRTVFSAQLQSQFMPCALLTEIVSHRARAHTNNNNFKWRFMH